MPFLYDTDVADDPTRGPVAAAFAAFSGQVERLVAVNLIWAVQLVPVFCALAFPRVPMPIRLLLTGYSIVAFIPATGVLFALARLAVDTEHLGIAQFVETARRYGPAAVLNLGPLYAVFGLLVWLALTVLTHGPGPLVVPVLWLLLVTAALGLSWGPAFAQDPQRSAAGLLRCSLVAAWRRPARTVVIGALTAVIAALGTLSVGGLFLVVPVLVALMQTTLYRTGARTWQTSVSAG